MKKPSSRMRHEVVTAHKHTWGKDADGGRIVVSTFVVPDLICSVQGGGKTTSVDETGRWTTEQPFTLRFTEDPGLKPHDEVTWQEGSYLHNLVVQGTTNVMARYVTFEVNCVERT